MLNMECVLCDSLMREEKRDLVIKRNGYELKLSGMMAYVCEKCGNVEFMANDLKMAEHLCKVMSDANIDLKEEYLDVSDMAEKLNVSNQTIYNMIRDKRLKPVKIGKKWRFYEKDIDIINNSFDNNMQIAARNLDRGLIKEDYDILKKEMEED